MKLTPFNGNWKLNQKIDTLNKKNENTSLENERLRISKQRIIFKLSFKVSSLNNRNHAKVRQRHTYQKLDLSISNF